MKSIRIGSRDSKLAIIQSQLVIAAIKEYDPGIGIELVTMKTTGDRILDKTLDKIGGKGLFVKELDQALYNNEVDITVHSYKDMPLEENPELPVGALSHREDPRDVLILPMNSGGQESKNPINSEATVCFENILKQYRQQDESVPPIGSSSLRRQIQLRELFSGCRTAPIRGNVQTRLRKLDDGEFSAIVLAAAGIKRLDLEGRISRYFSTDEILPAASQGIIAVQGRAGEDFEYLRLFRSEEALGISLAERTFVKALDGGCSAPIAAYAIIDGNDILLKGLYCNEATGEVRRDSVTGKRAEARELGLRLADIIGRIKS